MDIEWHEFEKLLITLQGKIEGIKEIKRQKGETFNIFTVLNMERREVETHSVLIYDLIYPNGSHSQGNKYLELFVHKVLRIEEFDFTNITVKREEPTDEGRRIDFTIENDQYYIVIEMKVDAGDQKKQLFDYVAHAKKQGKVNKAYYLTLDGKEASEKSTQCEALDYTRLSFALEILDWIEACIEKSATLPIIRESLIQYANIIRKITGQTIEEIRMKVQEMINTPKIAQAATIMAQNIGYIWALKEAEFLRSLSGKLNSDWTCQFYTLNKEILYIENSELVNRINSERAKSGAEIGIELTLNEITLYITFYHQRDFAYYTIYSDYKDVKRNINQIAQELRLKGKDDGRYATSITKIRFFGKGSVDETYELFDDTKFEQLVQSTAMEVNSYMEKINEILKQ